MSSGMACAVEILAAHASLKLGPLPGPMIVPLPVPLPPLPTLRIGLSPPVLLLPLPVAAVAAAPAFAVRAGGCGSELLPQATQFQPARNNAPIPTATRMLRAISQIEHRKRPKRS